MLLGGVSQLQVFDLSLTLVAPWKKKMSYLLQLSMALQSAGLLGSAYASEAFRKLAPTVPSALAPSHAWHPYDDGSGRG